jgi:hypothetical protein
VDRTADGGRTWSVPVPHTSAYQPGNLEFDTPGKQGGASTIFRNNYLYNTALVLICVLNVNFADWQVLKSKSVKSIQAFCE